MLVLLELPCCLTLLSYLRSYSAVSSAKSVSSASAASSASDGFSVGQRSVAHKKTMEYGIASSHDDVQGNPLGV